MMTIVTSWRLFLDIVWFASLAISDVEHPVLSFFFLNIVSKIYLL